ncbi:MAG TPA: hypothetical protein DGG22_07770 [Ruminococcaceae bacterium]|nr:hypothetical protein [Oscillospiraceae bacterium]
MTKAKKAISLIVSVVMLLGVLAVGVFANDNTGVAENGTIALSFDKASYSAGDTVKVTVKLTTDYYAATVSVPVQYDRSAVKFVSGTTASTLFGAGDATKTVVNDAAAGGKTYVYVGVLPQVAGGAVAQKANGVVLSTLTFTASKAISDTAAAFGVLNDQKTMTNLGGKLYVGSYKTSDVTSTVYTTGQKLTFPVMKAAAAADPELILTEEGNGAVIRTDLCTGSGDYAGCVFGIDTLNGENIEDFVTTKAGSIKVVANDQGNMTTGATILLKDDSGKVVATYVFIYFGDVNGDGAVNITDSSDVEAHDQWVKTIPEDTAAYYSCDVNADAAVNITDSSDIEAHDQWVKELRSQKEIAADFNKAW